MGKLLRAFVFLMIVQACLVLLVSPLLAQSCYTGASYSYGYQATSTYNYVPTTYATTYVAPKVTYQVQEVVVPKAVKAYVSSDYFASSADYYRDRNLIDAIAGKVNDTSGLQRELAELRSQIQRQAVPPTYPQQAPPPQQYAQPQQGYQGTPCDWRAQQAYEQGRREASQQYGQQQSVPQYPRETGYSTPQRQGYRQPQQYQQVPQYEEVTPHTPRHGQYEPQQPPQAPQQPQGQDYRPPQQTPRQHTPIPSSQENLPGRGEEGNGDQGYGPVPEGLQEVVGNSCLRCHGPTSQDDGKGFDMRNLTTVPLQLRMESYAQVASGDMPHKAQPLPKEQVRLFRQWYVMAQRQVVNRPQGD